MDVIIIVPVYPSQYNHIGARPRNCYAEREMYRAYITEATANNMTNNTFSYIDDQYWYHVHLLNSLGLDYFRFLMLRMVGEWKRFEFFVSYCVCASE